MKRLLFIIFCYAGAVCGQAPIQLRDAINTALKNNYEIQLQRNNVSIAGINNNIGVAGGLPIVTGDIQDRETVTSINQKYSDATRNVARNNAGGQFGSG